jgi:hypothetical protein
MLPAMPDELPTTLSHRVTRRQVADALAPAADVTPHERQRTLVQASLLTRSLPGEARTQRRGWVPG